LRRGAHLRDSRVSPDPPYPAGRACGLRFSLLLFTFRAKQGTRRLRLRAVRLSGCLGTALSVRNCGGALSAASARRRESSAKDRLAARTYAPVRCEQRVLPVSELYAVSRAGLLYPVPHSVERKAVLQKRA